MLSRRAFHGSLLASIAALGLPRVGLASTAGSGNDLWLNRLTFGATEEARKEIARMGRVAWVEAQLALTETDDELTARLGAARLRISYPAESDDQGRSWTEVNELRPLTQLTADPAEQVRLMRWDEGMHFSERTRPATEVIAASLIRAVHAEAQLREVMTQFWHDHFNVNSAKNEATAAFFPSYDAMLRGHAFGNFRALLGDVARAPAMLYYLNNDESRASPANENFARELLELHSLGAGNYLNDRYDDWRSVPGASDGLAEGYLDLDVYEVARAFTGWSVGDGRGISDGVDAPQTGRFFYVEQWHDPYQKRILGREFAPNRGPMEDGEEVLDMLARHPGTARFICTKIVRRLLTDTPDPALVAELAEVFLTHADASDQIAQVLRALVASPAFSQTPPGKVRRPFEFMAAYYRAMGAEIVGTDLNQHWQLARAGWTQHEYGPPTGHPDVAGAWTGASTLNRLVDFALAGLDDWYGVASADLGAVQGAETVADLLTRRLGLLGARDPGAIVTLIVDAFDVDAAAPALDFTSEDRSKAILMASAVAALSPEFLLR